MPLVSVVMGTFNGERYLRTAIDSILGQTFRDVELIVIDDCSTDHTPSILNEIKSARVRVVRNERNLGTPHTLNKGISLAVGKYVAFQDHDDLSLPARLSLQTRFLEEHPEVAMVGSSCRIIDASGEVVRDVVAQCDDAELRWSLLWCNPYFQTTLMVRRNVLVEIGGYSSDPMYLLSEDYEMMSRVAMRHRVANLPQLLGCWRMHAHSTSAPESKGKRLLDSRKNISLRNVRHLWQQSSDQIPRGYGSHIYEGMWSFQFLPSGEPFRASPDQTRCALSHLRKLECLFSRCTPGLKQTTRVRAARYYRWSKHAAALSVRESFGLKARAALLVDAIRLLSYGGRLLAKGAVGSASATTAP